MKLLSSLSYQTIYEWIRFSLDAPLWKWTLTEQPMRISVEFIKYLYQNIISGKLFFFSNSLFIALSRIYGCGVSFLMFALRLYEMSAFWIVYSSSYMRYLFKLLLLKVLKWWGVSYLVQLNEFSRKMILGNTLRRHSLESI